MGEIAAGSSSVLDEEAVGSVDEEEASVDAGVASVGDPESRGGEEEGFRKDGEG